MKSGNIDVGQARGEEAGAWRTRLLIGLAAPAADFLAVMLSVVGASVLYHLVAYDHSGSAARTLEIVALLGGIFVFINALQRRYRLQRYLTAKGQMTEAFNAWNVAMVAFIAIAFLAKRIDEYSRAVVLLTYVVGAPVVTLARWHIVRLTLRLCRSGRIAAQRVLLVGRQADMMAFVARHIPWTMGLIIQDAVTLREPPPGADARAADHMLGEDLAFALSRARQIRPNAVFIAAPWSDRLAIERSIEAFLTVPVAIHLAPEEILERFDNPRIIRMGSIPSLELSPPPMTAPSLIMKRAFDMIGAALLLAAAAPLLLLVAALIKLDSKGPVFFLQRRYGFNQEPFRIIKFRTMRTMDDGDLVRQATRDDPRITRVGAWLRRWNIDELPQLVNVLQGHMSLVGPRPHALAHDREFEAKIARYARRHNVKPGITGWAQVNGFRGETDTQEKMASRVAHDLWYIDNWNFWLDLIILMRTVTSPKAFRNAR